jgi:hypothetical protein
MKNKLEIFWETKLKKHFNKENLSWFFSGVGIGVLSIFYIYFLKYIASTDFRRIIPAIGGFIVCLLILLFYLVLNKHLHVQVEKNQSLFNIILIVLTIILTFSVYYIDEWNTYYKTNTTLLGANILNLKYANDFLADKKKEWIYWTYFLTSPYEDNLSFIGKNFSGDCSGNYLYLIAEMQMINEVNRDINNHSTWLSFDKPDQLVAYNTMFNEEKKEIENRAKSIKNKLDYLMNNCSGQYK